MKWAALSTVALVAAGVSNSADALDPAQAILLHARELIASRAERSLEDDGPPGSIDEDVPPGSIPTEYITMIKSVLVPCASAYGLGEFLTCTLDNVPLDGAGTKLPDLGDVFEGLNPADPKPTAAQCKAAFSSGQAQCMLKLDREKTAAFAIAATKVPPFPGKTECETLTSILATSNSTGSSAGLSEDECDEESINALAEGDDEFSQGLAAFKLLGERCEQVSPGVTTSIVGDDSGASSAGFGAALLATTLFALFQ